MSFKDFSGHQQGIELLQRSLERGRLGHAYLFAGDNLEKLKGLARTLAKTLNCLQPLKRGGAVVDCCDQCLSCQKIDHANHADVHWVQPESKSRVITIDQMREVMKEIQLKATEAEYKVAIVVGADRLRVEGANAFLKTLEEPPAKSILILLTTDAPQVLETIVSRCLRLNFGGDDLGHLDPAYKEWLSTFSDMAASEQKSLLNRYRLMDVLLRKLNALKTTAEERLTAQSPLERYKEVEKSVLEKWESELAAGVEAEYRRRRADMLTLVQWWLRDIWLQTFAVADTSGTKEYSPPLPGPQSNMQVTELLRFPELKTTAQVARRITQKQAMENLDVLEQLQSWLNTNVQEALALEVSLLKLHF